MIDRMEIAQRRHTKATPATIMTMIIMIGNGESFYLFLCSVCIDGIINMADFSKAKVRF